MPSILYKTLVILSLQTCLYVHISVADSELQPGDTIGPQNWERVKGMVGENLLNRIKQGYTFKLKEPKTYRPPKEYLLATEKFSGELGSVQMASFSTMSPASRSPNSILAILRRG